MKQVVALAAGVLVAGVVLAQPSEQHACEDAREASRSGDAVLQATYANCLVMGALKEPDALAHARELGRASMKQGNPIGAYAIYAAFAADPAFSFMVSGKPDISKYSSLGALPLESRTEQVEALEALGFAVAKGYPKAMLSLAAYYYETVAPNNVIRVRNIAALMQKSGLKAPYIEQFHKQGAHVASLGETKASIRAFFDAQNVAMFTARAAMKKDSAPCEQLKLLHVDSGSLADAVFLPLKAASLRDTYLVKGSWDETWRFQGCGREASVIVHFWADGWGGAHFTTRITP
ncbi:MAG TPA: hypothetical protein VMZ74_00595 [Ramlibacter sp.]|nr:hypothetical protein [Ramlibacter sp.]